MDSFFIFQLCTLTYSVHAAFWSCEGVVFLVLSSSSHFTTYHVPPLPLSGANWRSLSLLWGSGPPFPKMALPFTGSAHTPFPGSNTLTNSLFYQTAACVSTNHFPNTTVHLPAVTGVALEGIGWCSVALFLSWQHWRISLAATFWRGRRKCI